MRFDLELDVRASIGITLAHGYRVGRGRGDAEEKPHRDVGAPAALGRSNRLASIGSSSAWPPASKSHLATSCGLERGVCSPTCPADRCPELLSIVSQRRERPQ